MKTIEQKAKEHSLYWRKQKPNTHFTEIDIEHSFKMGAQFHQSEIDELKSKLEKTTKWISVKDELPKNEIRVIAKLDLDYNDNAFVVAFCRDKQWFVEYNLDKTRVVCWRYIELR